MAAQPDRPRGGIFLHRRTKTAYRPRRRTGSDRMNDSLGRRLRDARGKARGKEQGRLRWWLQKTNHKRQLLTESDNPVVPGLIDLSFSVRAGKSVLWTMFRLAK